MRDDREVGAYAGVLFCVLGVLSWVSGEPFVFPSLGPTAYVLATDRRADRARLGRVVGGHVIGAVAGFAAYVVVAKGATVTVPLAPLSVPAAKVAVSGTVAVAATTWGMLATDATHPPACATTLIVALGILSTPWQVGVIVGAVVVLVAAHALAVRSLAPMLPGANS